MGALGTEAGPPLLPATSDCPGSAEDAGGVCPLGALRMLVVSAEVRLSLFSLALCPGLEVFLVLLVAAKQ